jgi:hypothetical protein
MERIRKMAKQNCWEFKKCGRQPGGAKVGELGVCAAATAPDHNGKNGGTNGGRYCWKVAGTLCGGKVQGAFAAKAVSCMACDFFKQTKQEEGSGFTV